MWDRFGGFIQAQEDITQVAMKELGQLIIACYRSARAGEAGVEFSVIVKEVNKLALAGADGKVIAVSNDDFKDSVGPDVRGVHWLDAAITTVSGDDYDVDELLPTSRGLRSQIAPLRAACGNRQAKCRSDTGSPFFCSSHCQSGVTAPMGPSA